MSDHIFVYLLTFAIVPASTKATTINAKYQNGGDKATNC